ncbi:hypothetical protein LJR030_004560 [Rhizobium sp. LjRoot30]|uniref:hypothetical protein n=1 Tax=Rhizobium sp. LjRoot30 TaxID=3342320 RepID=UPI003ECD4123
MPSAAAVEKAVVGANDGRGTAAQDVGMAAICRECLSKLRYNIGVHIAGFVSIGDAMVACGGGEDK